MKWDELADQPCSIARSLAVVGDRWTLLVLRDCFMGIKRFEDLRADLAISRTILTERLNLLTAEGVLERRAYQQRPERYEYRLTDKGLDLYPVIMALVDWGNRHYAGEEGPPVLHRHRICGEDFRPVMTCSSCGDVLDPRESEARLADYVRDAASGSH